MKSKKNVLALGTDSATRFERHVIAIAVVLALLVLALPNNSQKSDAPVIHLSGR